MAKYKSLKRSTQFIIVLILLASIGIAAYAASVLWATAHSGTSLSKEHFLTVELSGSSATGSIKPGGSVSLSPAVTNNGDVDAGVFIKVTMPEISGSTAYTFEAGSGWNLVSESGGVQIWSYGMSSALEAVTPGSSTDALTSSFTMKSDITGAQFAAMSDVDIGFDGYLVEYEAVDGSDPESAWHTIPGNE